MKKISMKEFAFVLLTTARPLVVQIMPDCEYTVDSAEVKVMDSFVFSGSRTGKDEQCAREIKMRLILRRKAMTKLGKLTQDKNISI